MFEWNIKVIHKTQSLCCCLGNFFSGQMGIQTGEGLEWETSVRRGKSADAGGSRRGACVSSRTQYTYIQTYACICMYMFDSERKNNTHYLSACAGSVSVCVCAVACGPSAYQQLHSLRLKRNFNGITTAANTFELTKSSAKASLTLSCDSTLSLALSLHVSLFHSYSRRVLGSMTISIPIAFCDRRLRLRLLRVQQA